MSTVLDTLITDRTADDLANDTDKAYIAYTDEGMEHRGLPDGHRDDAATGQYQKASCGLLYQGLYPSYPSKNHIQQHLSGK